MEKKRSEKDKRYEERHKAERKAKCMVWGTSVPREKAEQINEFLKRYGYTKVQLIEAGYGALLNDAEREDNIQFKKKEWREGMRWREDAVFIAIAIEGTNQHIT